MKAKLVLSWMLTIALGCEGQIRMGAQTALTTFSLRADRLGALQLTDCLAQKGEALCTRYPNPRECMKMTVYVQSDGTLDAECEGKKGGTEAIGTEKCFWFLSFISSWVTIAEQWYLQVADIYGRIIFNKKMDDTEGALQQAAAEQPADPQPSPAPEGITTPEEPCSGKLAVDLFVQELNATLSGQGLNLVYQSKTNPDATDGIPGLVTACQFNEVLNVPLGALPIPLCTKVFGTRVCRCPYMVNQVVKKVCTTLLSQCESNNWENALWSESGKALTWLFTPGYLKSDAGSGSGEVEETGSSQGDSSSSITCTGSPLALDLGNDGLAVSSPAAGVQFDLVGRGPVQTAWLGAGDAFLALDRDNNGRIDGGHELFGEGQNLEERPSENGFAALSLIDSKRHGGNEDGVVDEKDSLFSRLTLWADRNHDGISQKAELNSLRKAGIKELRLKPSYQTDAIDAYGNDLGLRGVFVRKDGTEGKLIDVYFSFQPTRRPLVAKNR